MLVGYHQEVYLTCKKDLQQTPQEVIGRPKLAWEVCIRMIDTVFVRVYLLSKVRNPSSNICLDTLNKDEKMEFELGLFSCQGGKSSAEV